MRRLFSSQVCPNAKGCRDDGLSAPDGVMSSLFFQMAQSVLFVRRGRGTSDFGGMMTVTENMYVLNIGGRNEHRYEPMERR